MADDSNLLISPRGVGRTFLLVYGVGYLSLLGGGLALGARRWLDPHTGGIGLILLLLFAITGITYHTVKLIVLRRQGAAVRWLELGVSTGLFVLLIPVTVEILRLFRP